MIYNCTVSDHERAGVYCVGCGYNLYGIPSNGHCPECSTVVALSGCGDHLQFANERWLTRLRLSARVKLSVVGVAVCGLIGSELIPFPWISDLVVSVTRVIVQGLWVWAVFALTAQEPRASLHERTITLRAIVRYCSLIAVVGALFEKAEGGAMLKTYALSVFIGLGVIGLLALFLETLYCRRLAVRMEKHDLRMATNTLLALLALLATLEMTAGGVMLLVTQNPCSAAGMTALRLISGMASAVFGLIGVLYIILAIWYQRAFSAMVAIVHAQASRIVNG